ncbi:hypothetical protein DCCM_2728 [Desulfocucumis palustris]|uniref:Uncharacterized protein n=1 Tax=Desulfocucumis palustris TaxID=1898651 RepID=A0A2L2XC05_9FIRM|nr:hypothetical protein [Desulfocucumis palustris]GBF33622.1 hypothetical protein DCCM_2728 [Desulfocucumis palustris]
MKNTLVNLKSALLGTKTGEYFLWFVFGSIMVFIFAVAVVNAYQSKMDNYVSPYIQNIHVTAPEGD